jgi:hypothetical protein
MIIVQRITRINELLPGINASLLRNAFLQRIALYFVRSPIFILDVYLFTIGFFEIIFLNIYNPRQRLGKFLGF